jgi:hypothetical protein
VTWSVLSIIEDCTISKSPPERESRGVRIIFAIFPVQSRPIRLVGTPRESVILRVFNVDIPCDTRSQRIDIFPENEVCHNEKFASAINPPRRTLILVTTYVQELDIERYPLFNVSPVQSQIRLRNPDAERPISS